MTKIIFFGDSLSADGKINGCKATTPGGKVWAEMVPAMISAESAQNYAICGSSSYDLESQVGSYIKRNPNASQDADTTFYSILIGGNNIINLSGAHFLASGISIMSAAWLTYLQAKILLKPSTFFAAPLEELSSLANPVFVSISAGFALNFGITFSKNKDIDRGIGIINAHTENNQNNKFVVFHLPNMNKIPLGSNLGDKLLEHVIMPNYEEHVGGLIERPFIGKALPYVLAPFVFNLNIATDIAKTVFSTVDYWVMKYQIADAKKQITVISLDNIEIDASHFYDLKHPSSFGHYKIAEFIAQEINALANDSNNILYGADSSSVD